MQSLFEEKEGGRLVTVLVPYPVAHAYSYAVPEGLDPKPGDYAAVPLGGRTVQGVVWDDPPERKGKAIKSLLTVLDAPPMPADHRRFLDWVAQYTMSPRGSVLKMSLSAPAALERAAPAVAYRLSAKGASSAKGLSPQRRKVADILADAVPRRASDLAGLAGCGAGVVRAMAEAGLLEAVEVQAVPPCRDPDFRRDGPRLSAAQEAAARHLAEAVRRGGFHTALLDGVTGSGKTETYFEAVSAVLAQDRQVLILLPEIALSNAFLDRFQSRFGCRPALWHSALGPAQRRLAWRGVAEGETKVVVGARSALFLPYPSLGLIVVDEEHDPAYKQEDGVVYHARDMAVVRARLGGLPVALVSATPSLETMVNAWSGRYAHLHLPDRHGGAHLPEVRIVDMKKDRPERQHFLSPVLAEAVRQTLAAGEQSLLFLNRRGYAPLTLCRACGHRMECPRCTAWLVEHRRTGKLHCHHCGFGAPLPPSCPACGAADSFAACGPGVERVHDEARAAFPEARIVVLASDTAESQEDLKQTLRAIRDHEYDIVIGTQIIAKGHHFPKLTCVGVVDADLGLKGGDLRAAERTFQLLHQVAGRAGREDRPGRVFLQTFYPDSRVMQSLTAHERDAFLDVEAQEREEAEMPPYTRLVALIVAGRNERQVADVAQALGRTAPHAEGLAVFGPAEAPFYRLRGYYRRRLLVRAGKALNVQKAIAAWVSQVKAPAAVRIHIDIDPQSFL